MKNSRQAARPTPIKHRGRIALFAAPALAVAVLLSGAALAPAAQAAPVDQVTATPAQGTTNANLENARNGSYFHFINQSGDGVCVAGEWVPNRVGVRFKGAHSDNDWSGQVAFRDGTKVDLHANNPLTSEAYFQVGPHKIYKEAHVVWNGKNFHVKYVGGWLDPDGTLYKKWDVTTTGSTGFYTHEFVHHIDEMDGVKGTVTNKTDHDVVVKAGGANLVLKAGQRMVYYDAGDYSGDKGTRMQILRPGTEQSAVQFTAVDPTIGFPKVDVVTGDGAKDTIWYSEHQSKTFTDGGSDTRVTVTRQGDHTLPTVYERTANADWAVFDIDITSK
ncbi:MAG: hypothetical protein WCI74_04165 [Actinomycetes bacterium]